MSTPSIKLRYLSTAKGLTPAELELINFNWWTIEQGLNSVGASTPIPGGGSTGGTGGGTTNHHLLTHLTDFDDHTQYLYLNGRSNGQIVRKYLGDSFSTEILRLVGKTTYGDSLNEKLLFITNADQTHGFTFSLIASTPILALEQFGEIHLGTIGTLAVSNGIVFRNTITNDGTWILSSSSGIGFPGILSAIGGRITLYPTSATMGGYVGSSQLIVSNSDDITVPYHGAGGTASAILVKILRRSNQTGDLVQFLQADDITVMSRVNKDGVWDGPIAASSLLHNFLSSTHPDTVAGTPVRGDVIVANSTPKWTKLGKGAAGQVLMSGVSDVNWQELSASYISNQINSNSSASDTFTITTGVFIITANVQCVVADAGGSLKVKIDFDYLDENGNSVVVPFIPDLLLTSLSNKDHNMEVIAALGAGGINITYTVSGASATAKYTARVRALRLA